MVTISSSKQVIKQVTDRAGKELKELNMGMTSLECNNIKPRKRRLQRKKKRSDGIWRGKQANDGSQGRWMIQNDRPNEKR